MNITIFGASGTIGKLLVGQALEKGHFVTAYVRDLSKLQLSHPNLHIVHGELSDRTEIISAVGGADLVVSVLGPPLVRNYDGMPLAEAHRHIISAMKEKDVKRFITLATPSVKFEKDKRSLLTVLPGIMAKLFFPKPYKEIVEIGNIMKNSDVDWTVVRILAPNNKPATGKIKVSFGDKKISFGIARSDIAAFILKEAESGNY
ncbi:MAG: NAD(P)H-binding protein, partial [Bacteroidia bacterium]|nr:NAD(P)H-binding protein [Bacteroidia bacterium]